MQSSLKAAPSSILSHYQVNSPGPLQAFVLDVESVVPFTNTSAAPELHDRIEVWVNEGGTGGEEYQ